MKNSKQKNMKKKYLIPFGVLLASALILSFRWPLNEFRMTSSFGESRGDHFHDGVDVVCSDDKIYPLNRGKLLYFWDRSIFPLENEPGGGNFAVVEHEDGKCSVYMHMHEGEFRPGAADTGEEMGTVGNTGHSFAKHLHFSIVDRKERKSINPLTVLPAYDDKMAPEIKEMYIKTPERYIQIRSGSAIRLTRHYPILVDITDTVTGKERLGVYALTAYFNRQKVLDIKLDSIDFSEKGLMSCGKMFQEIFDEKGYYIIDGLVHRQGDNELVVIASDYKGNVTRKTFTYSSDLDMEQSL